jgi:hypothetical protein
MTLLYTVIRKIGVASASRLITTEAIPSSHSTGRRRRSMVSRQPPCGAGSRSGLMRTIRSARSATASRLHAALRLEPRLEQEQMVADARARQAGVPGRAPDHQEGRRRRLKIVPARFERARLEAEPFGRQQDAAYRHLVLGGRRRGPDLGDRERPVQLAAEVGERQRHVVRCRRACAVRSAQPSCPPLQAAAAQPSGAALEPFREPGRRLLK